MILRQLRGAAGWPAAFELHPRITVVRGLGPHGRHELARLAERTVLAGLGELDGVMAVDGQDQFLTPAAIEQLLIPAGVTVVLRPADLPGAVVVSDQPTPEANPQAAA